MSIHIDDAVNNLLDSDLPENEDFRTLMGFIWTKLEQYQRNNEDVEEVLDSVGLFVEGDYEYHGK